MDFKFSKGSGDTSQQEPPAEKKNQNALLVLLLILVGGFSYLYFFTGLIKQPETPKPAEAPVAQVVKIPLPAREGDTAAADPKAKDQKPDVAPNKAQSADTVKTPAAVPLASVEPATKVPTQPQAKSKAEPNKTEHPKAAENKVPPVVVVEKKAQKAAVAKQEEKKSAAETKSTPTAKKAEPAVRPASKKVVAGAATKAKKTAAATTVVKEGAGNAWALLVGNYVLEEALSTDMGRVRKAGFEPVVKPGARKKAAMNRLMLAEFSDRGEAQAAIAKLKHHTSDTFVIEQGGKHVVYAGSYLLDARAASEKERLEAAGFPVKLKHVEVAIPTQSLTIGPFSDKKAADAALGKLKGAGIKAVLVRQ